MNRQQDEVDQQIYNAGSQCNGSTSLFESEGSGSNPEGSANFINVWLGQCKGSTHVKSVKRGSNLLRAKI